MWEDVEARLQSFAALSEDWDSYGALPIRQEALEEARRVLATLYAQYPDRKPQVVPMNGGGVLIEWGDGNRALELEFDASGKASYIFWRGLEILRRGDVAHLDEVPGLLEAFYSQD